VGEVNFDHDAVPDVVEAELAVDRSAPGELAMFDVSLRLIAGPQADRTTELWDAWLSHSRTRVADRAIGTRR